MGFDQDSLLTIVNIGWIQPRTLVCILHQPHLRGDVMYQDIAVVMTGSDGDERALDHGILLASHFSTRLAPLQIVELPQPAYNAWSVMADPRTEKLYEAQRQDATRQAGIARAKLREVAVDTTDVRVVEALYLSAWEAAARECYSTDLIVVGKSDQPEVSRRQAQGIATLLMQSGLPTLVTPAHGPALGLPRKIVIGWRSSPEACRALHDALPLLREAESVDVLAYDDDADPQESARRQALIEHLTRHGVTARSIAQKSRGMDIASLLFAHAEKEEADLLVVGAYGHSRFREWAFGGVTREVLQNARMPVLLSH